MSLNPSGIGGISWNFSKPDKEGYSLEMWGTVVSLQEVQAREYNPYGNQPGRPAFWPDGNPKMNIRMGMAAPDGTLKSITFGKAGKKQQSGEKPSLHMQLFNLTNHNMMELIGKTLHLWTWPANPNTGQTWGQGNPRLFGVEEFEGKYELSGPLPDEFKVPELYANDAVQGGQPVPPQQVQQPPMHGQFYAAPTTQQQYQPAPQMQQQYQPASVQQHQYQPAPQPQAQPQPQPQSQEQPQPQPQPQAQPQAQPQQMSAMQAMPPQQQQQPMAAQMPAGMDPVVAQAMQSVGAVNVQPVGDPLSVYDNDIPF